MNNKDLKAVLLASALSGAAFVMPVVAEETNTDPIQVQDQTTESTQITTVDEVTDLTGDSTLNEEATTQVQNGWDASFEHYYENGVMATNKFISDGNYTYYFDATGYKYRSGIYYIGDDMYAFDNEGIMYVNAELESHYFGSDGKAFRNKWKKFSSGYRYYGDDGYYYKSDGYYINMILIDGDFYGFDANGFMVTGWQEYYGNQYYFNVDGTCARNTWIDNTYYVDSDGRLVKTQWIDENTYVDEDGKKTSNEWEYASGNWKYKLGDSYACNVAIKINGWYYAFDGNGNMYKNTDAYVYATKGDYYWGLVHANAEGHLIRGWHINEFGEWNYFRDNYFACDNGVFNINGVDYYFQGQAMVTSKKFVFNGKYYVADSTGACRLADSSNSTGWKQVNDEWYYQKNGTLLVDAMETINKKTYYFDTNGQMVKAQSFFYQGNYYYANNDGIVIQRRNSWYQAGNGDWYYFKEDGTLARFTTMTINNKRYVFSSEGVLMTGYVYSSDLSDYYLTSKDGALLTTPGWKQYDFKWFYVKDGGVLKKGEWLTENNKQYYFDSYGVMVTSTVMDIDGELCYFDTYGVLKEKLGTFDGWKKFRGEWYYSKDGDTRYTGWVGNNYVEFGKMATNRIVENTYYVDFNGQMKKGWIQADFGWFYADLNTGKLVRNQWKQINGKWYYFGYYMATGNYTVDGVVHRFTNDGVWLGAVKPNSWIKDPYTNKWLYVKPNGTFNYNTRVSVNGVTYYFMSTGKGAAVGVSYLAENTGWYDVVEDVWRWTNKTGTGFDLTTGWKKSNDGQYGYVQNGKLLTGVHTINGKTYYFDSRGELIVGGRNYNGKAIVCDSKGNVVNYKEGWNALEGQWFYIQNNQILTNTVIDGYYVGYNGLTFTGVLNTVTTYGDANVLVKQGQIAKNQWIKDYDEWYYADANGHKVRNQWVGNYYVDAYGRMVKNTWIGNYHVGADGKWDKTR